MRISSAPNVLANYEARKDAAMSLAAGQSVTIVPAAGDETGFAGRIPLSPDLLRDIAAGSAALTAVRFDDRARHELNRQGLALGAAGGAITGFAIGVLMDQWRSVHPQSALVAEAACSAIGLSLGGLLGSGAIEMDISWDWEKCAPSAHVQAAKP